MARAAATYTGVIGIIPTLKERRDVVKLVSPAETYPLVAQLALVAVSFQDAQAAGFMLGCAGTSVTAGTLPGVLRCVLGTISG
ncbi:MAG: hypothetical protein JWR32_3001 [Mycobacterium sp.]|jgi:hypothetical protein|nr:hypothetical protein [Mycobacterium sp.]